MSFPLPDRYALSLRACYESPDQIAGALGADTRERALHRYRTMKPRFTILPAGGPGLAAISLSGRF